MEDSPVKFRTFMEPLQQVHRYLIFLRETLKNCNKKKMVWSLLCFHCRLRLTWRRLLMLLSVLMSLSMHLLVWWEICVELQWQPTGVLSDHVHYKGITTPMILKLTVPLLIWSSRKTYGLLFDWLYPSRMPLLLRAISLCTDEPEVVIGSSFVVQNNFMPLHILHVFVSYLSD